MSGISANDMNAVSQLRARRPYLVLRAKLFAAIRAFFDSRDWLEVETPVRITAPAPEEYIETLTSEGKWLRPSPELEMKILVGAGFGNIYQIGPCFRANEYGRKHREEFTMLEYYAVMADYRELAGFTAEMIKFAALKLNGSGKVLYSGKNIDLAAEPRWLTVKEAFELYAPGSMEEALEKDLFDLWMVEHIEPALGNEVLTFLADYPASRASLARLKKDEPDFAERWEAYIAGIELANAFGELLDPVEQRSRFALANSIRKENGIVEYPVREDFFAALESGLPSVSGSALGLDRLAMIFAGTDDISDIRTF